MFPLLYSGTDSRQQWEDQFVVLHASTVWDFSSEGCYSSDCVQSRNPLCQPAGPWLELVRHTHTDACLKSLTCISSLLKWYIYIFFFLLSCAVFIHTLSYVTSWIDTRQAQSERANLTILFDKYVPYCLEQVRCNLRTITPIPESSMVQVRTQRVLITGKYWTSNVLLELFSQSMNVRVMFLYTVKNVSLYLV